MQHLVVLGHGDTEDDRGDVLETVDPLLPLGSLTAHIKQPVIDNNKIGMSSNEKILRLSLEIEVLEREVDLDDAGGLDPGPEDVLLRGLVVLGAQSVQVVQETTNHSLELTLQKINCCYLRNFSSNIYNLVGFFGSLSAIS